MQCSYTTLSLSYGRDSARLDGELQLDEHDALGVVFSIRVEALLQPDLSLRVWR